jgi:hypothetical protein
MRARRFARRNAQVPRRGADQAAEVPTTVILVAATPVVETPAEEEWAFLGDEEEPGQEDRWGAAE